MENVWTEYVNKNKLFSAEDKVLIAVSGGVDSVVLLDLMNQLPDNQRPTIHVAHVDHQLRSSSKMEAQFVQELADRYSNNFHLYVWDKANHGTGNTEHNARNIRYRFFKEIAKKEKIDKVLTAHHLNDQAETVLMKLIRGGLIEDKVGIQLTSQLYNIELIRPLLPFSKDDLYSYASANQLEYVEDESNHTDAYQRNRIRRHVLPLLQKENKQTDRHILEFSEELNDILILTDFILDQKVADIYRDYTFSVHAIMDQPPYLQRLLIKQILKKLYNESSNYNKHFIQDILQLVSSNKPNARIDLMDGWQAVRTYDNIYFSKNEETDTLDEKYQLSLNEKLVLSTGDELWLTDDLSAKADLEWILEKSEVEFPLVVRHKEAGDRLRVKGMNGSKKVKDIFIDQKVPLKERNQAWIITDQNNRLLTVVGYKDGVLSQRQAVDKISVKLLLKKN